MVATDTELRENLKTWKTALKERVDENELIAADVKIEDGTVVIDDTHAETFQKNLGEIKTLRTLIEGADATLLGKDYLSAPEGMPFGIAAAMAASGGMGTPSRPKTVGEMFIESDEFKALNGGKAGYTMRVPFETKMADLAGKCVMGHKDVYSDLPSGTPTRFGTVQRDPIVEMQRRRSRVRDLFPIQNTNSPVIEFFRQTGFVNNASPVPERVGGAFGLKPQSTISFEGAQTTVRTIAHWEAASRTVLADEPQLRGIIDTELLYGLQLVEDAQILNGTGTGEDLPGILNDGDIQQYAWSSGANAAANGKADNKADAVRRAITKVGLAYYEATGVVVHDNDWEDMELTKDANGQYLLAISIALGGEQRLWRLPVVSTPAITEGTALTGAFGLGVQLYDREQATIRVAEQHADFFIRNGIVVLAEERIGMAVKRPESLVEITFDHAPT